MAISFRPSALSNMPKEDMYLIKLEQKPNVYESTTSVLDELENVLDSLDQSVLAPDEHKSQETHILVHQSIN